MYYALEVNNFLSTSQGFCKVRIMKTNLKTPMEWFNFSTYQLFKICLIINFLSHCALAIPALGYEALDITKNNFIVYLFVSHIITVILAQYHGYSKIPGVFGACTTLFGFIPYLGWLMHLVTAVLTGPLSVRLVAACPFSKRHRPLQERIKTRQNRKNAAI